MTEDRRNIEAEMRQIGALGLNEELPKIDIDWNPGSGESCDFETWIDCPEEAPPFSTVTLKAKLDGVAAKDCDFQWYEGTVSGKKLGTERTQKCTYPFSGKQRFTCKVTYRKSPCNHSQTTHCFLDALVEDCNFKPTITCPPEEGNSNEQTTISADVDVSKSDCKIQWWEGQVGSGGKKLGTSWSQKVNYPVFGDSTKKIIAEITYQNPPCNNTKTKSCTLKAKVESCDFTPKIKSCPGKGTAGSKVTLEVEVEGGKGDDCTYQWYKGGTGGTKLGTGKTQQCEYPIFAESQKYTCKVTYVKVPCNNSKNVSCSLVPNVENCEFKPTINCPGQRKAGTEVNLTVDLDGIDEKWCTFQWYKGTIYGGQKLGTGAKQKVTYPAAGTLQTYNVEVTNGDPPCLFKASDSCSIVSKEEEDEEPIWPGPEPDDCEFQPKIKNCPGKADPGAKVTLECIVNGADVKDCKFQWRSGDKKMGTSRFQEVTYPIFTPDNKQKFTCDVTYQKVPCNATKSTSCTLESNVESCNFDLQIQGCPGSNASADRYELVAKVSNTTAPNSAFRYQWFKGGTNGEKLGTGSTQWCDAPDSGTQKYTVQVTNNDPPCAYSQTEQCNIKAKEETGGGGCPGGPFEIYFTCPQKSRPQGTQVNLTMSTNKGEQYAQPEWYIGGLDSSDRVHRGWSYTYTYPANGTTEKVFAYCNWNEPMPCMSQDFVRCDLTGTAPNPTPEPTPEPTPGPGPSPTPEPTPEPGPGPSPTPEPTPDPGDHRCDDVVCPEHAVCAMGVCNCIEGYTGVWKGGQLTCYKECEDPNSIIGEDGDCVCKPGYLWDPTEEKCKEECDSTPPHGGDGNCDTEDPCHGVTCIPPRECKEGTCVCPDGTIDINGLCLSDDRCLNVLCPPNSTCKEGVCICDEGYVLNGKGYCVMAETPDCTEEPDCCPSNATIQIKAGSGLNGGGSFRLNQPCDKTIMLWVDNLSEVADEECDENGQAQVCSCTAEISKLMDMIVELKSELDILKDNAEECLERNHCSGFNPEPSPEPTPEPTPEPSRQCQNHVASGKECTSSSDCPECEECDKSAGYTGQETPELSSMFRWPK